MSETYLTEREFCSRYKVAPRTVQRWRYTGEYGPAYVRLGGRRIAYRLSDCEAWATSQVHQHRAAELASHAA